MQRESAATAFQITCPKCGQRLRVATAGEVPGRIRIQCSACHSTFAVRRPGADPTSLPSLADSPTFTALPLGPSASRTAASRAGEATSPLPLRTVFPSAAGSGHPALPSALASVVTGPFDPGSVVAGRYRVVRFLARGGMGEVYEAEDLELKERVALKTVRPEIARDEVMLERFRREIQLSRKVTHPNVCRIFDVAFHRPAGPHGSADGAAATIFLTMEMLPGETLAQRLRGRGPFSPDQALPVLRQMAAALDAAHQAGVVHRDLKPGNVLLVDSAAPGTGSWMTGGVGGVRAVITDFGLARAAAANEDDQGLTLTAAGVVGTPAYIAPEQIEGREATAAVDLYAFGIVMYEMLTGKVPFLGDTALSTAVKRLQEPAPSPRLHTPDLDPRWEAVILRLLERDPAARFATASEALAALTAPLAVAVPEPAERSAERGTGEAPDEMSGAPAPPRDPAVPAEPVLERDPRRRRLAVVLVLLIAAAFAIGYVRLRGWQAEQQAAEDLLQAPAAVVPRRSVAVLGFKDLSPGSNAAWLSPALAEMLSTELGAGGDLRVVAGENVARAKAELNLTDANADTLARDTLGKIRTLVGTDYVVSGSYVALPGASPAGRQVRLNVHLQDAAAGEAVATAAETGKESELFDLVTRVGKQLRSALELGVGPAGDGDAARKSPLPTDPETARLYAEGVSRLRQFDPAGARDLLARAAAREPRNALVHAGLAAAWSALGYDDRARGEAKAAFDLSSQLPTEDRMLIEGRFRETTHDWPGAVDIYRRLWRAYPDNLDHGLRLAAAQSYAGEAEAALATADALRALPEPLGQDPRIDLAEATAAGARSDFARQQKAASRAAAAGQAQGARLLAAQARLLECRALRNLGRADAALAACEQGRALHAAAGDRAGLAEALTHTGNVLYDRGDLPGARAAYERALATCREIGSKGGEAGALNNIAVLLKAQGQLGEARALYEQVLAIAREIGSRSGEAYALNNIAALQLRRGEVAEARRLFEQTLVIRRSLGDRSGEAYALDNIGGALRRQGDLAGALAQHQQSLALRRGTGQKIGEVASLANLGTVQLDRGDLQAAAKHFQSSHDLARGIGNRSGVAAARFGLAEVLARQGDLPAAARQHQEALAERDRLGEKGSAAESRLALAEIRLAEGDAAACETLARTAGAELAQQGTSDGEALAAALEGAARLARKDTAGARAALERAARLVEGSEDLRTRLTVQLRGAEVRNALGQRREAAAALDALAAEATRHGLAEIRLEALLALAEVEAAEGRAAEARARRATVAAEARAAGYGLLARRAATPGARAPG
jgi:eukaryotic-like serine/threonine-protein kinase